MSGRWPDLDAHSTSDLDALHGLLSVESRDERDDEACASIVSHLDSVSSDILDSIPESARAAYVQDVQLRTYEAGDPIFIECAVNDGYYHVVVGLVEVRKNHILTERERAKAYEADVTGEEQPSEAEQKMTVKFGKKLCELSAGQGFGEEGHEVFSKIYRSASVVATERTLCLISSPDIYSQYLAGKVNAKIRVKVEYLERSPLFKDWTREARYQFAVLMRRQSTVKVGSYLCNAGESCRGMIMVLSGELVVVASKREPILGERTTQARPGVHLALLQADEVFGARELVEHSTRWLRSLQAYTAVESFFVATETLKELVLSNDATKQLLVTLAQRRREWESLQKALAERHANVLVSLSLKTMAMAQYGLNQLVSAEAASATASHESRVYARGGGEKGAVEHARVSKAPIVARASSSLRSPLQARAVLAAATVAAAAAAAAAEKQAAEACAHKSQQSQSGGQKSTHASKVEQSGRDLIKLGLSRRTAASSGDSPATPLRSPVAQHGQRSTFDASGAPAHSHQQQRRPSYDASSPRPTSAAAMKATLDRLNAALSDTTPPSSATGGRRPSHANGGSSQHTLRPSFDASQQQPRQSFNEGDEHARQHHHRRVRPSIASSGQARASFHTAGDESNTNSHLPLLPAGLWRVSPGDSVVQAATAVCAEQQQRRQANVQKTVSPEAKGQRRRRASAGQLAMAAAWKQAESASPSLLNQNNAQGSPRHGLFANPAAFRLAHDASILPNINADGTPLVSKSLTEEQPVSASSADELVISESTPRERAARDARDKLAANETTTNDPFATIGTIVPQLIAEDMEVAFTDWLALHEAAPSVLLVDDSATVKNILSRLFRKYAYSVDLADNGKTALERMKQQLYTLVVMDFIMPEMDGGAALEHIRAWEAAHRDAKRRQPVLLLSSLPSDHPTMMKVAAMDRVSVKHKSCGMFNSVRDVVRECFIKQSEQPSLGASANIAEE